MDSALTILLTIYGLTAAAWLIASIAAAGAWQYHHLADHPEDRRRWETTATTRQEYADVLALLWMTMTALTTLGLIR